MGSQSRIDNAGCDDILWSFYNKVVVGSPYCYRSLNWTRILDSLSVRPFQISISFDSEPCLPGSSQGSLCAEPSFLEFSVPVTFLPRLSSDD